MKIVLRRSKMNNYDDLQQEIDREKEKVKWVSVDDRLPENDKLKVCRYSDRDGKHLGIVLSRYYLPSNQKERKYWCFEFGNTQLTKITHWMSLPSLSKNKKEEVKLTTMMTIMKQSLNLMK